MIIIIHYYFVILYAHTRHFKGSQLTVHQNGYLLLNTYQPVGSIHSQDNPPSSAHQCVVTLSVKLLHKSGALYL